VRKQRRDLQRLRQVPVGGLPGGPPRPWTVDPRRGGVPVSGPSRLARAAAPRTPKCGSDPRDLGFVFRALATPLEPCSRTGRRPRSIAEGDVAGTDPVRFLLSWPCPLRPFAARPAASTPGVVDRSTVPSGRAFQVPTSCSALVDSHHLDGFLRSRPAGLLRPAGGLGVDGVVTRHRATLRRVPLAGGRTASLRPGDPPANPLSLPRRCRRGCARSSHGLVPLRGPSGSAPSRLPRRSA
jgi:hypothetical protein